MLLQVLYEEIGNVIRQKLGYDVLIAYRDANKVTVSTTIPTPLIGNMNFSAEVELLSVRNSSIFCDIDTGSSVTALILNKIKPFLLSKMPAGLVEGFDGQRLSLNLSALPQFKVFFENFNLNNIRFEKESLILDASMKFES